MRAAVSLQRDCDLLGTALYLGRIVISKYCILIHEDNSSHYYFSSFLCSLMAFLRASQVAHGKESTCHSLQERQVQSLGQEDPLEKETANTPVFLPGEFHGQRSLVGHSPWGRKKSGMTEWLSLILWEESSWFWYIDLIISKYWTHLLLLRVSWFSST